MSDTDNQEGKASHFIPNTFQYPNAYIDKYMSLLTPNENLVLTYAIRRIIGFQKQSDRISISQFSSGIVTAKGIRLDNGTGIGESAVRSAVVALVKYKIFKIVSEFDKKENLPNEYGLQWDSDSVDLPGLQKRRDEKKTVDALRTKDIHPPGSTDKVGVPRFDGQGRPGSTDKPGPGSTDDTHNISVENQIENQLKIAAAQPAAPPPPKQNKKTRDSRIDHPAYKVYQELAHLSVPTAWRDDVCQIDNIERWREIVKSWVGKYRPSNIEGMIDVYKYGWKNKSANTTNPPAGNFAAFLEQKKKEYASGDPK